MEVGGGEEGVALGLGLVEGEAVATFVAATAAAREELGGEATGADWDVVGGGGGSNLAWCGGRGRLGHQGGGWGHGAWELFFGATGWGGTTMGWSASQLVHIHRRSFGGQDRGSRCCVRMGSSGNRYGSCLLGGRGRLRVHGSGGCLLGAFRGRRFSSGRRGAEEG